MAARSPALPARTPDPAPWGPWQGLAWALREAPASLGPRALLATLRHGKLLRTWAALVQDLARRRLVEDSRREYLRAFRPVAHGPTGMAERIAQLAGHTDWLEQAFDAPAFQRLMGGEPVVLGELQPPRGYEQMRLQLQRGPRHSPEGELLLVLTLQRSARVQAGAQPVVVAVLAFTRIRLEGLPCLAIGGVRGQREGAGRLSATEVGSALHGWKAPVFLVRVAQELARWWGLHLVGLDPLAHRLQQRPHRWREAQRAKAGRIVASHRALWEHFGAKPGPAGWLVLPLVSDEKLEATALSPEKRARQVRRADYWIRTRNLLRETFRSQLVRQSPDTRQGNATRNLGPRTIVQEPSQWADPGFQDSQEMVPSRSLETGPGALD